MKIQLFCPKATIGKGANDGLYWPVGLLNIGTYIKQADLNTEVEIYDGELYPDINALKACIDPEARVVGISTNTINYENCLRLARKAKSLGLNVILGGPHATFFTELILQNQPYVDSIIYGKGERAFLEYVQRPIEEVSNLVWRDKKGKINRNKRKTGLTLDELPLPDYSLLNLNIYQTNHKAAYPDFPDKPMSIFTHEGCAKRIKFGRCSFCSIITPTYYRTPEQVWHEIQRAVAEFNFNFVKDWGDSLTGNLDFLERLVQTKPSDLDIAFSVYINVADIQPYTLELLKELNTRMIFGGFESGNDNLLKNMNKQTSVAQNLEAAKLCGEGGFVIFASYVLGARGETQRTLEDTLNFAEEITNLADVRVSNASPLVPLPGSDDFRSLLETSPKFKGKDLIDIIELKKEWVKHFCPELPGYEILEEYSYRIGELSPIKNSFGWDRKKYEK